MITQWFYESSVQRFHGLSTDTKPTDCTNGSVFVELDTAKIYLFNEAALTWHAIPDDIVVDSDLSQTSENPVQNKVVTKALATDRAALAQIIDSSEKNLCEIRNAQSTPPTRWVDIAINLEPGAYTVSIGNLESTDTDSTFCQATFLDASNQQISQWLMFSRGQNVSKDADITGTAVKFRLYPSNSYANSEGDTVTATDIMICKQSYYAISSEFVPYTPTSTSILTPISESAYEALTVKDKPLYFIYEDE